MDRCFSAIRGNQKLCKRLAGEIIEGRFPHAYILAGKPGSGKRTLAKHIAAALACQSHVSLPCGACESCQKVLKDLSPDVIYIRKDSDKKEFTVNLIREIKDSLYIAPNELEKRVYILEETETMNASAQNAFLKMLEEPPSYVIFLLLCSNTENLLETIKSRAPILYTERLPDAEIRSHLLEHSPRARDLEASDTGKLQKLILAADGSIGVAMELCEESEKHASLHMLVMRFLSAWTSASLSELSLFCDQLPSNADDMALFLSALKKALRDIAVYKHAPSAALLFFTDAEDVESYAARVTVSKACKLSDAADVLADKLKFYLDIRLAAVTFCGDARRIMIG